MKKTLILGLAVGLVAMGSTAFAESVDRGTVTPGLAASAGIQKNWGGEGIIGSSHDLSYVNGYTNLAGNNTGALKNASVGLGQTDAQKRICIYCHHPHNSIPAADMPNGYSPLWNRNLSTTTFAGYSNGLDGGVTTGSDKRHNLNAAVEGGGTAIAGVSLLCMSCHDGVVAMNAYSQVSGSLDGAGDGAGGNLSGRTSGFDGQNMAGRGYSGTIVTDMSNHHPMGFDYQAVQTADAEIAATNTALVPDGSVRIADVLYGGKMECVTCHDVHNTANQPGAERFLWRTNDHSNFCLTCHLK